MQESSEILFFAASRKSQETHGSGREKRRHPFVVVRKRRIDESTRATFGTNGRFEQSLYLWVQFLWPRIKQFQTLILLRRVVPYSTSLFCGTAHWATPPAYQRPLEAKIPPSAVSNYGTSHCRGQWSSFLACCISRTALRNSRGTLANRHRSFKPAASALKKI